MLEGPKPSRSANTSAGHPTPELIMSCVIPAWTSRFAAALLGLVSFVHAQFDLTSQWSDTANPNGPWSYNQGISPLPAQASWMPGSYPIPQPCWAVSATGLGHVPVWLKQRSLPSGVSACGPAPISSADACVGDVIVHSTDASSVGGASANVTWTSPIAGAVDICGGVWMMRDIGRANTWRLHKNGLLISQGTVFSGDPYSRAAPFPLSQGSGGSASLSGLSVAIGDVIRLDIVKASSAGDFCGVTLTISQSSTAPTICAAGTVGIGLGGPFDVLTINGTAGLPGRRVNVGIAQSFTFAVLSPPSNPMPANFVIAGYVGIPCTQDTTPLPGSLGTLCFLPSVLGSTNPGAFMLADSLGLGIGFLPATPTPWGFGVGGVGFPLQVTLQGLIEETPGVLRTTNAITLAIP